MLLRHYQVSPGTQRGKTENDIRDDFLSELGFGFLVVGVDIPTHQLDLVW